MNELINDGGVWRAALALPGSAKRAGNHLMVLNYKTIIVFLFLSHIWFVIPEKALK